MPNLLQLENEMLCKSCFYNECFKLYSGSDKDFLIKEKSLLETEIKALEFEASTQSNDVVKYFTFLLSIASLIISLVSHGKSLIATFIVLLLAFVIILCYHFVSRSYERQKNRKQYENVTLKLKVVEAVLKSKF